MVILGKRPSALGLKGVPSRSFPSLNVVQGEASVVPEGELIDLSESQDDKSEELNQTLEKDSQYFDSLLSIKETELPLYLMSCNGHSIKVLIDSGAIGSYFAPRIAERLSTRIIQGREVETAGGHILSINKQAILALDAQVINIRQWHMFLI